jgi:hypothetical protein
MLQINASAFPDKRIAVLMEDMSRETRLKILFHLDGAPPQLADKLRVT